MRTRKPPMSTMANSQKGWSSPFAAPFAHFPAFPNSPSDLDRQTRSTFCSTSVSRTSDGPYTDILSMECLWCNYLQVRAASSGFHSRRPLGKDLSPPSEVRHGRVISGRIRSPRSPAAPNRPAQAHRHQSWRGVTGADSHGVTCGVRRHGGACCRRARGPAWAATGRPRGRLRRRARPADGSARTPGGSRVRPTLVPLESPIVSAAGRGGLWLAHHSDPDCALPHHRPRCPPAGREVGPHSRAPAAGQGSPWGTPHRRGACSARGSPGGWPSQDRDGRVRTGARGSSGATGRPGRQAAQGRRPWETLVLTGAPVRCSP